MTNRSETGCGLALGRREGWKNWEHKLLVWGSLPQLPQKETHFLARLWAAEAMFCHSRLILMIWGGKKGRQLHPFKAKESSLVQKAANRTNVLLGLSDNAVCWMSKGMAHEQVTWKKICSVTS